MLIRLTEEQWRERTRELRRERDAAVGALRLVRDWLEPGVSDTSQHDTYAAIDDSVAHINSVLADLDERSEA